MVVLMFDIKRILGENIKALRKKEKLTQEQLSEKVGCSLNHLANIEIGKKYPSPELLSKIVDVLAVHPSALFNIQNEESIEGVLVEVLEVLELQNKKTQDYVKRLIEKKK